MPEIRTKNAIDAEWLTAYKDALDHCPVDFMPRLTELAFLAQRLINESAIITQLTSYQQALALIGKNFYPNAGESNGK